MAQALFGLKCVWFAIIKTFSDRLSNAQNRSATGRFALFKANNDYILSHGFLLIFWVRVNGPIEIKRALQVLHDNAIVESIWLLEKSRSAGRSLSRRSLEIRAARKKLKVIRWPKDSDQILVTSSRTNRLGQNSLAGPLMWSQIERTTISILLPKMWLS